MFSNLSLKYRIAIIIFFLEAIMLSVVLQQTLGQSFEASYRQITKNERAILELVSGISRSALITEEYAELQPYIEHLLSNTEVTRLLLADANKTIVASSLSTDIGNDLPELKQRQDYSWQRREIKNVSGLMGILAIEFSNKALTTAYADARKFGISIALVGMLIIAAVGILVGFLLTRRLAIITDTAQRLADGDFTAKTNIKARDELGKLAATFDYMVQRLLENKQEISKTLTTLQEREQNLAITLNSIGDAVITTDADGHVTRMNPVAEQLTGWSFEGAQGQPLKTIFPIINASTREPMENPIEKVMATGKTIYLSNHTTLIAKDGTEYQIADSAAPIRDGGGDIQGMVLVFNDVTEQYQLRQAVVKSEKKYQTLATVAPVGIFYTDKQGGCLYVNEKWCEITGISPEEATGDGWVKSLHPQDRELVFAEWNRSAKEGIAFKLEYRFQRANDVRWVLGEALAEEGEDGEVIGYVGTITDITDRKQAEQALCDNEQRFRQLAENINEVFWLGSPDWNEVFYISPAYEQKWGLSAEALYDKPQVWIEAVHPDDRDQVIADIPKDPNDIADYVDFREYRIRKPDGEIRWCKARAYPIRDDGGKVIRISGIVEDITERKQAEEALRRAQKMDAIGQLSGGIAHDFNNQLGIVIGYLDFLKNHFSEGEKPRQWADTATRATLRCMDLTRQLLTFSRRQTKEKTVVDLNATLKELETMIARSVTPEVEVQYFLADDLWPTEIDPGEFQDVIVNLVINARDAMPGGGKLLIETCNKDLDAGYGVVNPGVEAGDYIQLMLSDTGTGMDKETLEHVFEPFFTTKPEGKGTGLGMAMVYGFTKRYGGHIKVYSEPGVGTTIRIYLPRSMASESNVMFNTAHVAELPTGNESILIVDDEVDLLQLADQYLSDLGYHTHPAENAAQALAILEGDEEFDLLFSDVVMPGGMNGYELAQQAIEQRPGLKVLLTSGFTSKTMAHNGLARFSAHLLSKPYRKVDLAQRIRLVLDEETEI